MRRLLTTALLMTSLVLTAGCGGEPQPVTKTGNPFDRLPKTGSKHTSSVPDSKEKGKPSRNP